jgi:hypothetical protein
MCRYKNEGDPQGRSDCDSLREENWRVHEMNQKLHEEIRKLREERMTVDEREAIDLAITLEWPHTSEQRKALAGCVGPVCEVPENKHKVSIRRFLARQPMPPGPEGEA